MSNTDIRWQQRFQNFSTAMHHLDNALAIPEPDFLQKAGIIQFFEMSFELAWNLVKDYLEDEGFADVKSPRSALKKAFEVGLLSDGHLWMEMLANRNLTAHTYDEAQATAVEKLIHDSYAPLMRRLQQTFQKKIQASQ
jgi:nucleotidyltransferase substrate binding protein (TIGR01987 family)